jgi:hypothetical protein
LSSIAFVDFAWWHMLVHAYDSQKKAAQARNRHDDESLEQMGRKNEKEKENCRLT